MDTTEFSEDVVPAEESGRRSLSGALCLETLQGPRGLRRSWDGATIVRSPGELFRDLPPTEGSRASPATDGEGVKITNK